MDTRSQHWMIEYHGCDSRLLDSPERIEALMNRAAIAANVTVVASVFHQFAPQGVSGVVVIEESHLSVHTWPEHGYAAVDFFTCGEGLPSRAHAVLREALGATHSEVMEVERGHASLRAGDRPGGCRIKAHYADTDAGETPVASQAAVAD